MYVLEENNFLLVLWYSIASDLSAPPKNVLRKANNSEEHQVILRRIYFWKRDKARSRPALIYRSIFQPQISILDEDAYLFPNATLLHAALYRSQLKGIEN